MEKVNNIIDINWKEQLALNFAEVDLDDAMVLIDEVAYGLADELQDYFDEYLVSKEVYYDKDDKILSIEGYVKITITEENDKIIFNLYDAQGFKQKGYIQLRNINSLYVVEYPVFRQALGKKLQVYCQLDEKVIEDIFRDLINLSEQLDALLYGGK